MAATPTSQATNIVRFLMGHLPYFEYFLSAIEESYNGASFRRNRRPEHVEVLFDLRSLLLGPIDRCATRHIIG